MLQTSVGIWNLVNQTRKLDVSKYQRPQINDAEYEPFLVKQNLKGTPVVQRVAVVNSSIDIIRFIIFGHCTPIPFSI